MDPGRRQPAAADLRRGKNLARDANRLRRDANWTFVGIGTVGIGDRRAKERPSITRRESTRRDGASPAVPNGASTSPSAATRAGRTERPAEERVVRNGDGSRRSARRRSARRRSARRRSARSRSRSRPRLRPRVSLFSRALVVRVDPRVASGGHVFLRRERGRPNASSSPPVPAPSESFETLAVVPSSSPFSPPRLTPQRARR